MNLHRCKKKLQSSNNKLSIYQIIQITLKYQYEKTEKINIFKFNYIICNGCDVEAEIKYI